MDSNDVTREQAAKMREVVYRNFRYLWRVSDRMKQRGFPVEDALFVATEDACHALGKLLVALGEIGHASQRESVGERAERLKREDPVVSVPFANWA